MAQHLTVSSELVPFQEIDVYAKEAGYVKELNVDFGTHVKAGQVMAVLEIPELEAQLQQDEAAIAAPEQTISRATNKKSNAPRRSITSPACSMNGWLECAKTKPGLVAQQEVDDAQGKNLASASSNGSSGRRTRCGQE